MSNPSTVTGGWRYRIAATLLAMAGVIATIVVYRHYIDHLHRFYGDKLLYLGIVLVFFTGVFSFVVFGLLETQQRRLAEMNNELQRQRDILQGLWDATGVVASLPDMEAVLQRIVDVSRPLFGAQYAALAVLSEDDPVKIRQFITSGLSDEEREKIGGFPQGRGILGEVIRTKRVLRLSELATHPASSGFPPYHPEMRSFLGLPLLYRGAIVGHLYLTNKPGGFTAQDEMLGQLFARQASVVIANARLYQGREEWATVQERERIGRELHDGVLQTLYGLNLALDFLLDSELSLSDIGKREMTRITETLSLTMTDIRMYIQSLGSSPVDFQVAVRDMLQRSGGMDDILLEFRDTEYLSLNPELIHDLVMSVQEAVSNARRHGRADHIVVGWDGHPDSHFRVWIEDNGQGFNVEGANRENHFGLTNMRRRTEHWHGEIHVSSKLGKGTRVEFHIPKSSDTQIA